MKAQVLEFTSAFPPAQKAIETLWNVEYKKHLNFFLNGVETVCAFVYAIAVICIDVIQTWYENGGQEQLIEGRNRCQYAILWTKEIGIPSVIQFTENTYAAGVQVRSIYNTLTARQFVTLD